MKKTLIVTDHLLMAGAERLIFELVSFARANHIEPVIFILNNYAIEYYDVIFRDMNVKVIRSRIGSIKGLRNPANMIRTFYWNFILKNRINRLYASVQVIGLYNVQKIYKLIIHGDRVFWHVTNSAQYLDSIYPFPDALFANPCDTIICINPYQVDEIYSQYGLENIRAKLKVFKLFTVNYDTAHSS
ncbi:hypothetical protein [Mucilaginibacter aquaedulcis]|uniref:hypothetical protein n=1 Tax=Mucilaginibacter aquaedulcis TaxID=1187081 RepID=UPI0025B3E85E|nr:hypothetical protein [Mucilaginibacter aquaedulcis]MDN3548723.1 hypothetical protein [Mucilaginibacter aquaedulcis]